MRPRCTSVGPEGYRCRRREHGPVPPDPLPPLADCHSGGGSFWDDETAMERPLQCVSLGSNDIIWDVTLLQRQAESQPVVQVPVDRYVAPEHVNRRFSYWRTVDVHTPIILAPHPETGRAVVLDGRHRLFKAWKQGRATVPAVVLSEAQERAARLNPEDAAEWLAMTEVVPF